MTPSVLLRLLALARFAAELGTASAEEQPPSRPDCTWQPDTDYDPTSSSGTVAVATKEECCAACFSHPTCRAGTFQENTGQGKPSECYLKGGLITAHKKQGVMGCLARKNPPLPKPFDCSAAGANCAGRLGATHWNPCYFINSSAPVLLDGARSLAGMGARVIKLALFSPKGNYPFNSPQWPDDSKFSDLLTMAQHPYYRSLWSMDAFDTYVLIAYSTVGGAAGGDISYYTRGISAAQIAEETAQFKAASGWLLENYPAKTFVFENWEGDWGWLQGRQEGVTQGRASARAALGAAAITGNVFFSAEVNLVQETRLTGIANMINQVIPYVKLDMVSYSSYDSQNSATDFPACLDYISQQHNRTAASPRGHAAYFVAEYGVAENLAPNQTIVYTVQNVVDTALSWGAAFALFWETFDNECTSGPGCTAGRCHDAKNPVTDPKRLHGFWLTRPDGSHSWPYQYLQSKIAARR